MKYLEYIRENSYVSEESVESVITTIDAKYACELAIQETKELATEEWINTYFFEHSESDGYTSRLSYDKVIELCNYVRMNQGVIEEQGRIEDSNKAYNKGVQDIKDSTDKLIMDAVRATAKYVVAGYTEGWNNALEEVLLEVKQNNIVEEWLVEAIINKLKKE